MKNENNVDWFDRCENCEQELPTEKMYYDSKGVPLCPKCWKELNENPDFYSDDETELPQGGQSDHHGL